MERNGFKRRTVGLLTFWLTVLVIGVPFAQANVAVDNNDPGTSYTGTWRVSGGSAPYGADSLWARDGATYTWQFDSQPAGTYEVLMWWSDYPSRAANVPVTIRHQGGISTVNINQQENAGQWNRLGSYSFDSSGSVTITAAYGSTVSTCADAVELRAVSENEIIIDNRDASTSRTGTWAVSGASGQVDVDSVWSRNDTTFTWHFTPPQTGDYQVSMWWTAWPSRSANVPVDIQHAGSTQRVYINQQENASQWNTLGSYHFEAGSSYALTITSQPGPSSTCADAVRFVAESLTELDHIELEGPLSVNENSTAQYEVRAFYADGTNRVVTADSYTVDSIHARISSTGALSTSEVSADEPCRITASYSNGGVTRTATLPITIMNSGPITETIIDNGDSNTFSTGTWTVSGASNPYGIESLWSRNNTTYTWTFAPQASGYYELFMWWTVWDSRTTAAPVTIERAGGVDRVYVNQKTNGGQWNSIGLYPFVAGEAYDVTVTARDPYPISTCADAVKFRFVHGLDEPFVRIIAPESHSLQTKTDLSVQVTTGNLKSNWGIKFVLDMGTSGVAVVEDRTQPYEALFSTSQGEHTVDALVVDDLGREVSGTHTHDRKTGVGVGEYYVALGDSITEGVGDNYAADDVSRDGRNTGGGYEPILNDLLTDIKGYPHVIVNEGVGGEKSADGLKRLAELLAAHPDAQKYLILFGTNDSSGLSPVPSGCGLNPGDPGYSSSYKDNMQNMIAAIIAAGKEPALAKVPITLGPCSTCTPFIDPFSASRNTVIRDYNVVIEGGACRNGLIEQGLISINAIAVLPPDFYSYFSSHQEEFFDNLHPNGVGYRSMAELWLDALNQ